jgi:hypothetical protein
LAAELAAASIAEDILDLTADDVGVTELETKLLNFHGNEVSPSSGGFAGISTEMEGDALIALSRANPNADRTMHTTAGSAAFRAVNERDSSPNESNCCRVVSVVLTSPTEPQVKALQDRFFRCLHRLRSVLEGSLVVQGAGVPELLCAMELESVIARLDRESAELNHQYLVDTFAGSSDENCAGYSDASRRIHELQVEQKEYESRRLARIAGLLRSSQCVLIEYVRTISINNGATWTEASEAIEKSKIGIKRILGMPTAEEESRDLFSSNDDVGDNTTLRSQYAMISVSNDSSTVTANHIRGSGTDTQLTHKTVQNATFRYSDTPHRSSNSLGSKLVLGGRYSANDTSPLDWGAARGPYKVNAVATVNGHECQQQLLGGDSVVERIKALTSDSHHLHVQDFPSPVYIATDIEPPKAHIAPVLDAVEVKTRSLQAALTAVRLLMGTGAVIKTTTTMGH